MRDLLSAALERLERLAGVRGALFVDAQAGVPVATGRGLELDPGVVAALVTAFIGRLSRVTGAAELGGVRTVRLLGEVGSLVVAPSGDLLVIVLAEATSQMDELHLEARRVAEELR